MSEDTAATVAWLLDGDPAIRWKVLRDLTDASAADIETERALVATSGWGDRLLALQDPSGPRPPTLCCCCTGWACREGTISRPVLVQARVARPQPVDDAPGAPRRPLVDRRGGQLRRLNHRVAPPYRGLEGPCRHAPGTLRCRPRPNRGAGVAC